MPSANKYLLNLF